MAQRDDRRAGRSVELVVDLEPVGAKLHWSGVRELGIGGGWPVREAAWPRSTGVESSVDSTAAAARASFGRLRLRSSATMARRESGVRFCASLNFTRVRSTVSVMAAM